jgi:hypothetical protein
MGMFVKCLQNKYFVHALYVVTTIAVFFVWVWTADTVYTSFNGDPRSKLSALIDGTAHRPFVQRVLVPVLTRVIQQSIPESWEQSLSSALVQQPKIHREMQRLGWEEEAVVYYLIALTISFLFLLFFIYTLRSIMRRLYNTEDWIGTCVPILVMMGLPMFFHAGTRYIYDFPALALFTLGFLYLIQGKWPAYYFIFFVGLVNKETTALLVFLFILFYYKRYSRDQFWAHCFAQCALALVVRGLLSWIFRNNPGSNIEFHLFANIRYLSDMWTPEHVAVWFSVVLLVFIDFENKPLALRKGLLLIAPFLSLMLLFGCMGELRALYEIYPIIMLLAVHTVLFVIFRIQYRRRSVFE